VNQIFAAMQSVEAWEQRRRPVEGILLYPAVAEAFRLRSELFGHSFTVTAVDLSRNWREIETQLLTIIGVPCSPA
jgi:hypothetical protein